MLTLTKTTMSLLLRDDPSALMSRIPKDASVLEVELQGEKIAIKCAEAGAMRCLEALLDREPASAQALLSERDGTLARVVDLAAFYADATLAQKIIRLTGPAIAFDSDPQGDPGALFTRALKGAQWDAAMIWLQASPESAKTITAYGRSMLHLLAERSFEHEAAYPDAVWPEPPKALAARLLELDADPAWASPKGYGPLSRAIVRRTRSVIDALLDWQQSAAKPFALTRVQAAAPMPNFSPLHEAVWVDDAQTLDRLIDLGGDLNEPTALGSSPLRLAIRRDAFACAQILLDRGVELDDSANEAGPLSLSALRGSSPLVWLDWLKERGSPLFGRDGLRASFTEVAMETLSFNDAKAMWSQSPEGDRQRHPLSLLSAFERAARSDKDPVDKMKFLLSEGLLPARVDAGAGWKSTAPRRLGLGDGIRVTHLGPLWLTGDSDPDVAKTIPLEEGEHDDEDEDDFSVAPAPVATFQSLAKSARTRLGATRPSLLGYLTARGARDALAFLLEWDAKTAHFRDPDYILAWREGLRSDSPMSVMKPLAAALSARSLPLWADEERALAFSHFGPKKGKDLGFAPRSASAFVQDMTQLSPASLHGVFDREGQRLPYEHAALAPWTLAKDSAHPGAFRAILPDDGAFPALCCSRSALCAAVSTQKTPVIAWIADSLPARAAKANSASPWGREPQSALSLWDQQIEWEYEQELKNAIALNPADASKFESRPGEAEGFSSRLLKTLIVNNNAPAAARLIRQGMLLSGPPEDLLYALSSQVSRHSSMSGSHEQLMALRDFCDALVSREDLREQLRAITPPVGDSTRSPLARMPDPVVFETLMNAGVPVGSASCNVFSALARSFASRLSPAFSQRLAEWAQRLGEGGASLDVVSALASMRRHHSLPELADASAAATERALRAASNARPEDWEAAHRRDACPIESALAGGNLSIATRLAALAPAEYRQNHGAQWAPQWLIGRARNLEDALASQPVSLWDLPSSGALFARAHSKALSETDSSSEDADGSPKAEQSQQRLRNLQRIESELQELRDQGSSFGQDLMADTKSAVLICDLSQRSPGTSLLWALCHGLRPEILVSSEDLPYSVHHHLLGNRKGRRVPALAACLGGRDHALIARVYVEWALRDLPLRIEIQPPLEDALNGANAADFAPEEGEPRELIDLLPAPARAIAEEMLLERELAMSARSSSPSNEEPALARPRRAL